MFWGHLSNTNFKVFFIVILQIKQVMRLELEKLVSKKETAWEGVSRLKMAYLRPLPLMMPFAPSLNIVWFCIHFLTKGLSWGAVGQRGAQKIIHILVLFKTSFRDKIKVINDHIRCTKSFFLGLANIPSLSFLFWRLPLSSWNIDLNLQNSKVKVKKLFCQGNSIVQTNQCQWKKWMQPNVL